MKESVLWRRLDRAVGTRLRARYKNKESGVAMVMALMFILVVLLTSTLLLGILLSQALPYRNNSRNAQGKVAAEAGLQAGLSFLRTAESYYETGNYHELLPTATADTSKPSLDETFVTDTVSVSSSSSSTGTAKVAALNYVQVNDTSSGTTAVSTSSSTHNQKLSYRIQIGYYDGDPNDGGKLIADSTQLSKAKYAVVLSYGYVDRFPDGRSAGTEADPVRTVAAIYKFGQLGSGTTGTPMRNKPMEDTDSPWIIVSGYTTDANGDLDTVTTVNNPMGNLNGNYLKKAVPDPRNDLCFVATTDGDGNINPSKPAKENSAVRVFRKARQIIGTNTYEYSEYCKANGKYQNLNKWVYGKDDSIRLASDTSLCMTGVDITHRSVAGGTGTDGVIRLKKCGTSYSPAVSGGKVVPGVGMTWQDQGYDTAKELGDPDSLLNRYQKWGFYYGFVNAGYVNFGKYGSGLENTPQYSTGALHTNGSEYRHTLFQTMYAQRIANANVTPSAKWGQCDADVGNFQYGNDNIGGSACFLASSQWTENFGDKGTKIGKTFAESLGSGGEAGWNTNQIVSSTGACMHAWSNGSMVATKQCYVNAAPSYSYCYSTAMDGTGDIDEHSTGSWIYACPLTSGGSINWKDDGFWYTKGTDGLYKEDASGNEVLNLTLTTITSKWSQSGYRPYSNGSVNEYCYYVGSEKKGEVLRYKDGPCVADPTNLNTFYRFEYVGKNSKLNYKFVLASTFTPSDPEAEKPGTKTPMCLTEMTNGLDGYTYVNEPSTDGSVINDYFNTPGQYSPNVVLQPCTNSTKNALGQEMHPQEWNNNSSTGSSGAQEGVSASSFVSYASSKYVDAANWKW
ncbi:hypothetical protein [Bifidobacterium thermophilum]|uniref:hypothetical protein n=1 Tax=Bifidobacterium thermophilum TaxID=33905 RepID=UPI003F939696